jgi:hypothetical protein
LISGVITHRPEGENNWRGVLEIVDELSDEDVAIDSGRHPSARSASRRPWTTTWHVARGEVQEALSGGRERQYWNPSVHFVKNGRDE